jgi:hypothetical protein
LFYKTISHQRVIPLNEMGPSWSHGSWIYNYLCNQCILPLPLRVRIPLRRGVLDTTPCDKVCQWVAAGRWFSPVSFSNKTDRHDIGEILLKVALNTIKLNLAIFHNANYHKLNVLTCEKTHSHSLGSCLLFGCCEIILRKQHIVHNS